MTLASTEPAVVDGVDLDAVAAAVQGCAGVDALDGGPPNARLATYLPGRAIDGLKVADDLVTVQIRGVWNVPVTTVADQIRTAVAHLVVGRPVDIIVADLTPAPGYEPEPEPEPKPPSADVAEAPAPSASQKPSPPQPQDTAAPVPVAADPVVVERTLSVTEKVVQDDAAAEAVATAKSPPQAPEPGPTVELTDQSGQRVPESEGDPVVWVTATPTDVGRDATTSAPTTPTPAEIPPHS